MLYLRGLDFTSSPEEIRDIYLIAPERRRDILLRIFRESRGEALSVVITCTRIEAYTTGSPLSPEILERAFGFNHLRASGRRYATEGDEALHHLYEMSTGILSALYGEEMIMSQITDAIKSAEKLGQSSSYLSRLFSSVINFARKERNKRRIRVFDSTVSDYISKQVTMDDRILIIGSNENARMIAETLVKKGMDVTMTLRDESKIFLLPPGTKPVGYDRRKDRLEEWSVIISSSSGLYHTLDREDGSRIKARLLYDLSVPYDIADELHPVRLSDLPVEFPERESVETGVREDAHEAVESFKRDAGMKDLVDAAGDIAFDTVRRMFSVVASLDVSEEEKERVMEAIRDSSKKAAISWFNREKNRRE